jgi:hypothetical protein
MRKTLDGLPQGVKPAFDRRSVCSRYGRTRWETPP